MSCTEDNEGIKSSNSHCPATHVPGLGDQPQQKPSPVPQGGNREDEGRRWSGPAGSGGGILRLDPAKPRRSSAASVEFKTDKDDPSSPCPSDRLSVTWADGERSVSSDAASLVPRGPQAPEPPSLNVTACGSLLEEEPVEEDLNASITAILKRSDSKGSRRGSKKKRKTRRTSTMTTSSGETVVEMESTADEVAETLRIHKEVLAGINQQPWPIARKLRLARTAREYIQRHEGELEERLAQSTSTKDLLLRNFIRVRRLVRIAARGVYLWVTGLEPWQGRIKTIESHFGSAVASYFIFLRWVLGLNVALTALLAAFVVIPEFLASERSLAGERKSVLVEDKVRAFDFKVMWDFEGVLRYSPVFYGYYSKIPTTREGYRLPLAYFLTCLAVYAYSFIAILRKMAANSRMSKLAEDDECTFSWRLLAGWDFTIGNLEAAQNKVAAINTGFRESLLEAKELEKEEKSWKLRARRVLAHLIVLLLIIASAYAVVLLVQRSEGVDASSSWYRQNELTIILTLISMIYPNIFDIVGLLEVRHPRNQLQWQLARIMALNLLNLYTLIFALFSKVDDMTTELGELKSNLTETYSVSTPSDFTTSSQTMPLLSNESRFPWLYINTTDVSYLSNNFNISTYDTLNASQLGITESMIDLTTASMFLPTTTPGSTAPHEGQPLGLGTTLGTTLLAAAAFTGLPLSKFDPKLKETLPPGCHLVPVRCLTTATLAKNTPTPVITSPSTTTVRALSTTAAIINDTPATKLTSPTTFDYYDWFKGLYDKITDDPSPGNEGVIYEYDDNNVSTTLKPPSLAPSHDNATISTESPGRVNTSDTLSKVGDLGADEHYFVNFSTLEEAHFTITSEALTGNDTMPYTSTERYENWVSFTQEIKETELPGTVKELVTPSDTTEMTTRQVLEETEMTESAKVEITPTDSLDRVASSPLTSEIIKNEKNEALMNLVKTIPGLPAVFNTLFLDYLEENEEGSHTDNKREKLFNKDDSAERRMKRAMILPYVLKQEGAKKMSRVGLEESRKVSRAVNHKVQSINKKAQAKSPNVQDFIANSKGDFNVRNVGRKAQSMDTHIHSLDRQIQSGNQEIQDANQDIKNTYHETQSINQQVAGEEQGIGIMDEGFRMKNRLKRVINYNDYDGLDIYGLLDSPKFRLEPNDSHNLETNLLKENSSNEARAGTVNDSGKADQHSFTTTEEPFNLATHDRASYWVRIIEDLKNIKNRSELNSPSYGAQSPVQPSTEYLTWTNTTKSVMDGALSSTRGPDYEIDDDLGCYVILCNEPIKEPTSTFTPTFTTPSMLSAQSSTIKQLPPTQSSVPNEAPSTPVPTTEFVSSTIVSTEFPPSTSTVSEPPPFLVQPMKDNPEKWAHLLPSKMRQRLRKLCWETMFGQEIIKLTVMDMVVTVVTIVIGDYIRAVIVRLFNGCCCWDLEKQFPGYPDFKIAENILHLVNNQGMIWMGMFFSPGLPALNTLKLVVLLYVRSWAVVTSNVPPETVFKASNNNNFYLLFLLTMLFLCTLPVGYAVVWLEPSWHCGPFSDYPRIYQLATSTLIGGLPTSLYPVVDYVSSPGVVIPAGLLLVLIIYYLLSLTAALREANSDLRDQLRQERSAEKRKAQDARSGKGRPETPTTRWGRVAPMTPMPRARLDATSDPEKPANKKTSSALSPEGENYPVIPLSDPSRGKDEGSWPDDVTDLEHSEVFDDSLSEPRRAGKDMSSVDRDTHTTKQEGQRHERDRGKDVEKENGMESSPRSPYSRPKNRRNSHSHGTEDEKSLSKTQRGRQRTSGSQHRSSRTSQDRKQSDESSHRDSPTMFKPGHRESIDSPKERKRKGSGPQSNKIKHKMPEECVQELNEVLQHKEAKQRKSSRFTNKTEPQKVIEPETPTKIATQAHHHREPSILKMEDLHRNSQGKNNQQKNGTQPGHHRSSSEDSQSMHTIPVIKISKEDSVERSLQQAKLERQEKMQDDQCTSSEQQSLSTTDTASLSPAEKKDLVEMQNVGQVQPNGAHQTHSVPKSPPTETDLDDPYFFEYDPTQTSETVALLGKNKDKSKQTDKMDELPDTHSSDDEATLVDQ